MAAKLKTALAEVVPFFRAEDEPEVKVSAAPVVPRPQQPRLQVDVLDLTGKPKVVMLLAPGGAGKTFLARLLGERMADAGREALLCALDPGNRALARWFEGVEQPPSADSAQSARWLRAALRHLLAERESAIMDFGGGGDVALAKLVELAPDIADTMSAGGVELVACYLISPRIDDLAILDSLEQAGFQPRCTMLVLNEGRVDSALTREEAFARILRHSAFRSAVSRGAVPIWFPKLEPEVAAEIEGKQLTFGQARDGLVPEGRTFSPIGGIERAMVRRWLERVEQEFAPVHSWMP